MATLDMSITSLKYIKKNRCLICKEKKPVIIAAQYERNIDDLNIGYFCLECFKIHVPEYSLENNCLTCFKYNHKCDLQKLLFSKKEIKDFKKRYFGGIKS